MEEEVLEDLTVAAKAVEEAAQVEVEEVMVGEEVLEDPAVVAEVVEVVAQVEVEEAKVHAEVTVIVQTMLLYVVIGVTAKSHVIPIVVVEEEVVDLAVVVETAEVAQVEVVEVVKAIAV